MNELGAELDGDGGRAVAMGKDAATYSIARFDDYDVESLFDELTGGGESGSACADDDDVCFWHCVKK